jgi:hypothetical protein
VELRNHEINLSLGRRKQNGLTREEDVCNLQILGGMKNKKNSNGHKSVCGSDRPVLRQERWVI